MHEFSLAEAVLQIIEESAAAHGFARVKTVWLEIGALAGVDAEAMRFCFDAAVKGTIADGTRLEIIETAGQGRCMSCSNTVSINRRYDPCPHCGCPVQAMGGMALKVRELEVE